MKILWCHEVSYRSKPVYEYQDFPERLVAKGHDVEVIDFEEGTATGLHTERLSRTGEGEVTLSSIPHGNLPVLKYFEARWRFNRMLKARLSRGDIDAVFVYSVFINGTQAVRLARRFGVPVIYRVLDAYHRLRPGAAVQGILRAGERYIYRNVDRVLVTNDHMARYVEEIAAPDLDLARVAVLDHGADTDHFAPRDPDRALCAKYGLTPQDKVALFLGTTYGFSGLVNLVDRMPAMIEACPEMKLVIVGGGELDEALRARVSELGLTDRVVLTGMVPYQEVPRHLSLGTLALNPFEVNDITRDIVPIKILQYQACGLPVLSTPLPDLVRAHPPGESGVFYSESDHIDDFVARMTEAITGGDALNRIGARGREFIVRRYSVRSAIERLESELIEACKAKGKCNA